MKAAVFIGVDPSLTNTGFVVLNQEGNMEVFRNSKNSTFMKKAAKADVYTRLIALNNFLAYELDELKEFEIYAGYEGYSFNSVHKALTTGEIGGVLRTELIRRGIPTLISSPLSLKKFATSHGFAEKEKMQAQAKEEHPFFSSVADSKFTSDIADAYFLAKMAWYRFAPEDAVTHDNNKQLKRNRLTVAATGEVYGQY